jgi:hypothetical protein
MYGSVEALSSREAESEAVGHMTAPGPLDWETEFKTVGHVVASKLFFDMEVRSRATWHVTASKLSLTQRWGPKSYNSDNIGGLHN